MRYWHLITHSSVNIDLSLKNEDQQLSKAEVLFMNSDGNVLAGGIRDMKRIISFI